MKSATAQAPATGVLLVEESRVVVEGVTGDNNSKEVVDDEFGMDDDYNEEFRQGESHETIIFVKVDDLLYT